MLTVKRALFLVIIFMFAFAFVADTKPASAATEVRFSVTCSQVVLNVTGAQGRTFDLLVQVPSTGFFKLLSAKAANAAGEIQLVVDFPTVPDGTYVYTDTIGSNPSTGFIVGAKNCGFESKAIPSGFVLAEITCDVAVFQMANENYPTSASIKKGQTWFVNPTSTAGTGAVSSWNQVFVSGPNLGYIPTSCVSVIGGR